MTIACPQVYGLEGGYGRTWSPQAAGFVVPLKPWQFRQVWSPWTLQPLHPVARKTLWLFDLDDTLHRATPHIFDRMNQSMTRYVMQHLGLAEPAAGDLRRAYWERYGATLLGLMQRHAVDPVHFLKETHQFPDLAALLDFDRPLRRLLKTLPGRKIIVSNAPRHYVDQVLALMGISPHLHAIETIESMRYVPKPARSSLARILKRQRRRGERVVMVEDNLANLKTARRLGLTTVWVSREPGRPAFVDVKLKSVLQLSKHSRLRRDFRLRIA